METGALIRTFSGHTAAVNAVAFSPDGSRVLTGSGDGTARLWASGSSATTPSDAFEPNDTPEQAAALPLNVPGYTDVPNLSMGSDGVDWYEISVPAMTHLSIDIVYDQNLGALNADLWDRRGVRNPLSFGLPQARDYRGMGTSRLVYVNTTAPERLYLRVFGPVNPAYAMMIETIDEDDMHDINGVITISMVWITTRHARRRSSPPLPPTPRTATWCCAMTTGIVWRCPPAPRNSTCAWSTGSSRATST